MNPDVGAEATSSDEEDKFLSVSVMMLELLQFCAGAASVLFCYFPLLSRSAGTEDRRDEPLAFLKFLVQGPLEP